MISTELPLDLPGTQPIRQARTEKGKRAKPSRNVDRAQIVRLGVTRVDDDRRKFRTTFSLDSTVYQIACLLMGGEESARARLVQLAEQLWADDLQARHAALQDGDPYRAPASISRNVQAAIVSAAAKRLGQLHAKGVLHLPVAGMPSPVMAHVSAPPSQRSKERPEAASVAGASGTEGSALAS